MFGRTSTDSEPLTDLRKFPMFFENKTFKRKNVVDMCTIFRITCNGNYIFFIPKIMSTSYPLHSQGAQKGLRFKIRDSDKKMDHKSHNSSAFRVYCGYYYVGEVLDEFVLLYVTTRFCVG